LDRALLLDAVVVEAVDELKIERVEAMAGTGLAEGDLGKGRLHNFLLEGVPIAVEMRLETTLFDGRLSADLERTLEKNNDARAGSDCRDTA
jgi:hypothetical protein